MTDKQQLRINQDRFLSDFKELAAIGAVGETGVNRPSFSEADLQAREWFREKTGEAGLEFRRDGAANVSAFYACARAGAKTLLLGSHLDTVYNGGRYDGSLGVLSALEVLRIIKENNIKLPFNLEAISFSDEEGTLLGFLGSNALIGELKLEELQDNKNARGDLTGGMRRAGITPRDVLSAHRDTQTLAGYLELHIEQGPNLLKQRVDVGVVSGIVGVYSYRLTYSGRADHAGTTPMNDRLDASQGAAAFIQVVRKLILSGFPGAVVNTGQIHFEPGGFNIVPETAVLSLEFRSADKKQLKMMNTAILKLAEGCAREYGLGFKAEFISLHEPALMHAEMQKAIRQAAEGLGLSALGLPSGAGHDAQCLASVCPAGMIFVPSQEGGSHSPREFTTDQDCINGANVLLQTVLNLAETGLG